MSKPLLSKQEFQDWQEANQWFWEHLENQAQELLDSLALIGVDLAYADKPTTDKLRVRATVLRTKAENMREVCTLEYEDVFPQEEETDE
jgi:hypothetical protein